MSSKDLVPVEREEVGPVLEPEVVPRAYDFYHTLRRRIRVWAESKAGRYHRFAEYILWAPDLFHLLLKLISDPEVPKKHKVQLGGAIVYFISPLDLMPDLLLGPVGFLDDIALAAFVLNNLLNDVDPRILRKHWAGDEDVLLVVRRIVKNADRLLGKGLALKVRTLVGGRRLFR